MYLDVYSANMRPWYELRRVSRFKVCELCVCVCAVRSCAHLQVLELERITDLSLQVATELCSAGLKSLQTLILTHSPVSGQAILHFYSESHRYTHKHSVSFQPHGL